MNLNFLENGVVLTASKATTQCPNSDTELHFAWPCDILRN